MRRLDLPAPNPSGLCQCGCGAVTAIATGGSRKAGTVAGEHVRFMVGHAARLQRKVPRATRVCQSCRAEFVPLRLTTEQKFCSQQCGAGGATRSFEELFWERVSKDGPGGCWIWIGSRNKLGYGFVRKRVNGKTVSIRAHRYAWEMTNGPIEQGLFACHHCDRPSCVNPDHLFIGTAADNVADMRAKGRGVHGEAHPFATVSSMIVRQIRLRVANGEKQCVVAREFNVSPQRVSAIVKRRSWAREDDLERLRDAYWDRRMDEERA